jgi:outer membrane protein assembly factor BamB
MEHYEFVGDEGIVVAVGAASGQQKWRTSLKKFILDPDENAPTQVAQYYNLVFAAYCKRVFKLDAESGRVIWRKRSDLRFSLELALILDGVYA